MTSIPTPEPSLVQSGPTPIPASDAARAKAAILQCVAAFQRAFKALMDASDGGKYDHIFAEVEAGKAYRNAMPVLSGRQNIGDFIACAAHGILIGAIPPKDRGHLLYAAQVAFAALPREEKKERKSPLP